MLNQVPHELVHGRQAVNCSHFKKLCATLWGDLLNSCFQTTVSSRCVRARLGSRLPNRTPLDAVLFPQPRKLLREVGKPS